MIIHPVWPTAVPPVPSLYWTQKSWNKWNYCFKPTRYHGDPYSRWDWMLYELHRENDIIINFYMEYET